MNEINKSLIALNIGKAIDKTCIKCGEIEELCYCNEFENIMGRKTTKTKR